MNATDHISISIPVVPSAASRSPQDIIEDRSKQVWNVAKRALAECVLALTFNVAAMAFFATPVSIPILSIALAVSFIGNCILAVIQISKKQCKSSDENNNPFSLTQLISRFSLAYGVGIAGPNIAIHEMGHAAAALSCFRNANPSIYVKPFYAGITNFTSSNNLTFFGKLLGKHNALLFIGAAGITASLVFAMCEIGLAHKLSRSHPVASQLMNYHAIGQIFNEVIYGLTAFLASKKDLGHDLVRLWQVGNIHPLIPIAAMVILPLAQIAWLFTNRDA